MPSVWEAQEDYQAKGGDCMPMPCVICDRPSYEGYCFQHKPRKPLQTKRRMNKIGRVGKGWIATRKLWLMLHEGDNFECFYCKRPLEENELTLDHYKSRSRYPQFRDSLHNLVPCCLPCNQRKGSLSGDEFLKVIAEEKAKGGYQS